MSKNPTTKAVGKLDTVVLMRDYAPKFRPAERQPQSATIMVLPSVRIERAPDPKPKRKSR